MDRANFRNFSGCLKNRRLDVGGAPEELRDLAGALNGMLARLQDSFTRLSQFSADLAHDFRTPISNLVGQTQVTLAQIGRAHV